MIETKKSDSPVFNQQLFSEAYLDAFRTTNSTSDAISACYQTLLEWREELVFFTDQKNVHNYVRQCLSSLGFLYVPRANGVTLVTDNSSMCPIGLCLIVNNEDLGCTVKGSHHQVKLIQSLRSTSLSWGVVTNGKHWRLCYAPAAAPYETFLEIDLDRILREQDMPNFVLFYHFFGYQAFAPLSGSDYSGLEQHKEHSAKYMGAMQRYLKSSIERILQSLCLGFVQGEQAEVYTRETLDTIYHNATYLLYRILFLFCAEARRLLPTFHEDYRAVSLDSILQTARYHQQEGYQDSDSFSLWKKLTFLCVVVDEGATWLDILPYNGGLFNDTEKPYLKTHKIANPYLASALFELGYMQEKGTSRRIPIDYRDLSARHLGTLYESLLEFRLHLVDTEPIVVRESNGIRTYTPQSKAGDIRKNETFLDVGRVYFANDKGERKLNGTYYTPEDVVQYIATNTVIPKLQELRAPLDRFIDEIYLEWQVAANDEKRIDIEQYADRQIEDAVHQSLLKLRILDPAMGSGHFLVAAGQIVTNFIVETLNMTPWPNSKICTDPLLWKRRVVERCLYGVDVNELALELAKLALWLSSTSKNKPLTFLDHHLKAGNSLHSALLARLPSLPAAKNVKYRSLFQELYEQTFQNSLHEIGKIVSRDSERIEDVKSKGEANRVSATSTQALRDIAHLWLATLFGLHGVYGTPVDENEYQQLVGDIVCLNADPSLIINGERRKVIHQATEIAAREDFFHWELEFPDAVVDHVCTFDIVIGNPPYAGRSPNQAIETLYSTARCRDIYAWMLELELRLAGDSGYVGIVVPLSLLFSQQFRTLRAILLQRKGASFFAAFDIRPASLFGSSEAPNSQRACIYLIKGSPDGRNHVYTTNLLRWTGEERPRLLSNVHFCDTTIWTTERNIPKLGDNRLIPLWERIISSKRTIGTTRYRLKKDQISPRLHSVYVANSGRYFVTAMPTVIHPTGMNSFAFEHEWDRDIALVMLNSNVFYWLWCVLGDGFHITVENVEAMVFPNISERDEELVFLRDALLQSAEDCKTHHNKLGMHIVGYNFNKRMDILFAIDDFILKLIASDLHLPRDIFAQYKSSSFLRPLQFHDGGVPQIEDNDI